MADAAPVPCVVLDTNAALDLYVFDDPLIAPLAAAFDGGRLVAVTDAACMAEWQTVLRYPALALDEGARERAVARHAAHMRWIETPDDDPFPLPRCRDADDQKFLRLAAASGARALLTRDAELLRLARRTAHRFAILTPRDWCREAAMRAAN